MILPGVTIGDEAMIVGSDPAALTEWAVAFQRLGPGRTLPRIAIHYGNALYRDGDYYGRDVNIASRVQGLAMTPSILATGSVIDHPQSASLLGNGHEKPVARQHTLRGIAAEKTVYEIP